MIKVENLVKEFGSKRAVAGVTFDVKRGEVLGFLGPNGAGKSTTMRMITGFIPPTGGKVTVGGHDIVEDPIPAKKLIGYLPENAPLYTDMTVFGFLHFIAELRGMRGDAKSKAVDRAVEMCFLEKVIHQSIDTLSKGYRHRTGFAQAIIHDPEVLILDEPTDGLDPNQKHEVRGIIRRMGEKKAIIFSTHILEEVEAVCSRAIIIDQGKIVANGTPEELKRKSVNSGAVTLCLESVQINDAKAKIGGLPSVSRVVVLREEGAQASFRVFPGEGGNGSLSHDLFTLASESKWALSELHTEEGRLDEVFRNITLSDTELSKKS